VPPSLVVPPDVAVPPVEPPAPATLCVVPPASGAG
jgi:hypothetical protein